MKYLSISSIATVMALCIPAIGSAAVFTNGSFETLADGFNPPDGSFVELGAGATEITGWVVTAGSIDVTNTNYAAPDFVAADGLNSIDLNGSSPGGIAQTFDTTAGQHYVVSFDLNSNPYDNDPTGEKSVLVAAGDGSGTFNYPNAMHPLGSGGPWLAQSFGFTATGTSTTLSFTSLTPGCCQGAMIDNVSLSPGGVPEPATWALLIAGFGMTGAALRASARRTRRT